MKNGISSAGLAELAGEIAECPAQGLVSYGVDLHWQSGTRGEISALPMRIGDQTVNRGLRWTVDEPRQLGGSNHAPNPQEYLLSGLAGCLMVSFVVAASVRGIQIEQLCIEVHSELDLAGFLGVRADAAVAMRGLRYCLHVSAEASDAVLEELRVQAQAHSPNAQTLMAGLRLQGAIRRYPAPLMVEPAVPSP